MQLIKLSTISALAATALAQGDLAALLASQQDLSTLLSLVGVAGLNQTLSTTGNITIFAPTNSAFAALDASSPEAQAAATNNTAAITALLQNHVVPGVYNSSAIGNVPTFVQSLLKPSTNGTSYTGITGGNYNGVVKNGNDVDVLAGGLTVARVTQADIAFGSGVIIHKVDRVLNFAPSFLEFTARAGYTAINAALVAAQVPLPLGASAGNSTSTASANATDYTIFIPNNAAFTNIGSVLATANQTILQAVLGYHVIAGSTIFSPALGNITAPSLQGNNLTFTVANDGSAWVNNAKIIQPNIIFYNGVAHVIDSVLNPLVPFNRSTDLTPSAPASSRIAFAGASAVSSLPFSSVSFSGASSYTTTAAILTTGRAVNTGVAASNTVAPSSSSRGSTGAAAPTAGVNGLLKAGAAVAAAGAAFVVAL